MKKKLSILLILVLALTFFAQAYYATAQAKGNWVQCCTYYMRIVVFGHVFYLERECCEDSQYGGWYNCIQACNNNPSPEYR